MKCQPVKDKKAQSFGRKREKEREPHVFWTDTNERVR